MKPFEGICLTCGHDSRHQKTIADIIKQADISQAQREYIERLEGGIEAFLEMNITPATSPKLCAMQIVLADALASKPKDIV